MFGYLVEFPIRARFWGSVSCLGSGAKGEATTLAAEGINAGLNVKLNVGSARR